MAYIGSLRLVIHKKTSFFTNLIHFVTIAMKKTVVLGSSMQKNFNICRQDFSKSSESISIKLGRHNRMGILQVLFYYYVCTNINYGFMVN